MRTLFNGTAEGSNSEYGGSDSSRGHNYGPFLRIDGLCWIWIFMRDAHLHNKQNKLSTFFFEADWRTLPNDHVSTGPRSRNASSSRCTHHLGTPRYFSLARNLVTSDKTCGLQIYNEVIMAYKHCTSGLAHKKTDLKCFICCQGDFNKSS